MDPRKTEQFRPQPKVYFFDDLVINHRLLGQKFSNKKNAEGLVFFNRDDPEKEVNANLSGDTLISDLKSRLSEFSNPKLCPDIVLLDWHLGLDNKDSDGQLLTGGYVAKKLREAGYTGPIVFYSTEEVFKDEPKYDEERKKLFADNKADGGYYKDFLIKNICSILNHHLKNWGAKVKTQPKKEKVKQKKQAPPSDGSPGKTKKSSDLQIVSSLNKVTPNPDTQEPSEVISPTWDLGQLSLYHKPSQQLDVQKKRKNSPQDDQSKNLFSPTKRHKGF